MPDLRADKNQSAPAQERRFPRLEFKFALLVLLAALPFALALALALLNAAAATALRAHASLLLLVTAVAVAGICLLRRDLHARVRELHEATHAWAMGDTEHRVPGAADSPGAPALAADFNRMAERIEAKRDELARSAQQLRRLVDMACDWHWTTDAQQRFTGIAGREPADAAQWLGRCLWDIARLQPVSTTWREHRALRDQGKPFRDLLLQLTQADDALRFVEINGDPLYNTAGMLQGYCGTARDVTRLKQTESQASRNEARFRGLIEGAPEAIVVADFHSGMVVEANSAAAQLFGCTRAQLVGIPAADLGTSSGRSRPETLAAITQIARRVLAGESVVTESQIRTMDGRDVAVETRWMRLPGEGKLLRAALVDVSERRRVEAERERLQAESADRLELLRASEARFRQLTMLSSDWYWEQDAQYRFLRTDTRGYRGDKPLGESAGMTRWERAGTRAVGTTWEAHRRDLEAHRPFAHLVLELLPEDGLRRYVAVRGEPIFDNARVFTGYRGVGADISERYRNDLVRAGERAVYEALAADASLAELMTVLCSTIDAALARPGIASLLLLEDGVLRPLANPGAPAAYDDLFCSGVVPGPRAGCCGTAAFEEAVVICADIASDPRWDDYRELAETCGFASGWSTPVLGAAGQVLATFAVYCTSQAEPVAADLELTRSAAALAAVLIERFRAQAAELQSEARYKSLVEMSREAVLIHDGQIVVYANPAAARMLAAPDASAVIGCNLHERLEIDAGGTGLRRRRRVLDADGGSAYTEMRLTRLDDSVVDVEVASGPVDFAGRHMVQTSVHDISARKWAEREMQRLNESLEQTVARRTAELTAAARELEAFSYTVAHDLRAPLRAIDGYAQLLRLESAAASGPAAWRDLDMIVASARRMGVLIDGLLEFSRLGRSEAAYQRIATAALVASVVAEARNGFSHQPQVDIRTLPDVFGDPAMLRQVWVNLIFNAFKFSAQAEAPRIVIDCVVGAGEVAFSVADNGAGFDGNYAEKLFGMFQRLHSRSQFEGTGVGLAIVKRVIERHHGRVWGTGTPGRGATFHFTLPATSMVIAGATPARPAGAAFLQEQSGAPAP